MGVRLSLPSPVVFNFVWDADLKSHSGFNTNFPKKLEASITRWASAA
jgi:hypothetical protein